MKQQLLGKTGLSVSALGFGGAEIGFSGASPAQAEALLDRVLDTGVNFIDTAAAYLTSEELIGRALGGRRKQVVLATKCGAIDGFSRSDWSKGGILRTVQESLRNLRTDYVDILFLHSCGEIEMSMGEALAGAEAAKQAGHARFIGYSGDGAPALWAVRSGRFDVIETSLSILDREALELHLPEAERANLGIVTKRSIGNAVWRFEDEPADSYVVEYWRRWRKLDYRFAKEDPARIASVALRYTAGRPGVHCAIVGTTKAERFRENIELLAEGPLEREIEAHIEERWREAADRTWVGQV